MPFKPVTQEKCPRCEKSVYAAEARAVGELKFHKECYKCSTCNKMIDSTNSNCHERVLYCKTCYGRKFGPKGYGFGGGAAGLSTDTGAHLERACDKIKEYKAPKAAPGEGCPRCGGKVFAAELMMAKGKNYHKTCFKCKTCRKPLDSMNHCDGADKEVYCKLCYTKKFGLKGYGFGQGAGTLWSADPEATPIVRLGNADVIIPAGEGEEGCPRCGGKVYSAETMLAKGKAYHRRCFKCKNCKRALDSITHCDGQDGEVYCKLCYAKKYGPKGYGFAAGAGGVLTAENIAGGEDHYTVNPGQAALNVTSIKAEEGKGCPRCGGKVFMAEEVNARGRSFHRTCYSCCICHRPLDSVVGCDAPDGEVYCKLCYGKRYGPKGYGFAAGSGGVLTAENISGDTPSKMATGVTSSDLSKIQAPEGEGCPRCGGMVYMAEEMHVRERRFHKRCYNCCHCHRPLDSVVGCDSPDGEVYCKLCYAKKYGPKGYGFAAGGGGVLTAENIPGGGSGIDAHNNTRAIEIDTRSIMAAPGEGCPRCGGKVFSAEEKLSRGKAWHKRCYSCTDCRRPLDSMIQCDAPDGDIYCKLCYAKKFGPKGYGFAAGQGGVLFPESIEMDEISQSVSNIGRISMTNADVTRIPAKEGQSKCPRCSGAVFQAEAICVKGKEFHKCCYSCVECKRPLDSMVGCDAPDGEVYCRLCYAKRHGPKGYGYGQTAALVSLGTDDGTPIPVDIRQFGFDPKGTGKGPNRPWAPPATLPNQSAGNLMNGQPVRPTTLGPQGLPIQTDPSLPRGVEPEVEYEEEEVEEEEEYEEVEVEVEEASPTTPPPQDEEVLFTDIGTSPDFPTPPPPDFLEPTDSNELDVSTDHSDITINSAQDQQMENEKSIDTEMYNQMQREVMQKMSSQIAAAHEESKAEVEATVVQQTSNSEALLLQQKFELQKQQMEQQKLIQQQMQSQLTQQMQNTQLGQVSSESTVQMTSSSSQEQHYSSTEVQQTNNTNSSM